jgi:1-deoxy-D-xylulose-5-phosphate synthase
MPRIIDAIVSPADLKALDNDELAIVAREIRDQIVATTSVTGGHVASSLGAVETIVALHAELDCPRDRIVFDVGHQAYAHKILTGRLDRFDTLRQRGGISGFPTPAESPYDVHPSGHASDSLSVALGIAKARDLEGRRDRVVAVIGDAAISGNSAAGNIDGFLYVILNAFHQTAQNYIGQNAGAGQFRRIRKIFWLCLGYVTVFGIVFGVLIYVFGPQLLSIYIPDSAEAIACGMIRLLYVCLPYFIFGVMDVTTGALRGIGAAMTPMIISVLGICGIRLVWIYTIFEIPLYHTLDCLFFSYLFSWIITLIGQMIAFFVIYRRAFGNLQQATDQP